MTPQQERIFRELRQSPHKLGHLVGYDKLDDIHSQWIRRVYESREEHVLMAHRGSYKTTAISIIGAVWYLFFWPNETLMIVSATADNASKIVSGAKKIYDSEPMRDLYRMRGITKVKDPENWKAHAFSLLTRTKPSKDSSLEAASVSSIITGRHFSKIIADDVVTLKDRVSPTIRMRRRDEVKDLYSIIHPGRYISWVGTPWHPEDLYTTLPAAEKFPAGTTGIEGFTPEYLQEIRERQGESFFTSQYLLEPTADEEYLFGEPHFYKQLPEGGRLVAYLDPALGGSDYSALTIGKKLGEVLYIVGGWMWQGQIDETYDRTERLCRQHNVQVLHYEENQAQRLIGFEMKRRGLAVKGITNTKNKHLRIMSGVKNFWDQIQFSPDLQDEYLRQVLEYTEVAEHDDAPDSLAGLSLLYFGQKQKTFSAASRRPF